MSHVWRNPSLISSDFLYYIYLTFIWLFYRWLDPAVFRVAYISIKLINWAEKWVSVAHTRNK